MICISICYLCINSNAVYSLYNSLWVLLKLNQEEFELFFTNMKRASLFIWFINSGF